MKRRKKQNPLAVVYFMAAFGFTYLLMPYALEMFDINPNLEIISRLKSGQIFLEFLIFVAVFVIIAFFIELLLKKMTKKK